MKIVLASNSPRRKQLLQQIGVEFEVIVSNVEEEKYKDGALEEYVKELSYLKAKDIFNKIQDKEKIVIGADTIVAYNGNVLGKPKDKENAYKMLKMLQGNVCEVITGLCVIGNNDKIYNTSDNCKVFIQKMTDEEIWEYINTEEPMDKAGAFAIQGIGAKYITKIEGDYYSAVGLPINKLYNILKEEKTKLIRG